MHRLNRRKTMLTLGGILLFSILYGQEKPKKHFGLPDALQEVSGLYYAGPDSLWWHNDSGDRPTLYLTNGLGEIKQSIVLPVRNVDWEDITADDQGTLFIGDFGNNNSQRRDLKIYAYTPASGVLDSISFRYPDQATYTGTSATQSFDVEGFFWHQDSLHLFSKSKLPKSSFITKHYVLADQAGEQVAELRDSLYLKNRVVTAAAIDRNSGRVGLLTYCYNKLLGFLPTSKATVFFFDNYPEGHFLQGTPWRKKASCLIALQYESLDFLPNGYLYIASEQTRFIPPKAKRLRIPKRRQGVTSRVKP
ncbi:MAG: hypothetical protein R2828_04275 [Saprospiraceae bacterium]